MSLNFYTIVCIVAVILLIIVLTLIAVYIPFTTGGKYPNYQQPCPDAWKFNTNGTCTSVDSSTNANPKIINPAIGNPSVFLNKDGNGQYSFQPAKPLSNFSYNSGKTSYSGICAYKKWAKESGGITWDGVTNYDNC
jgi:hypothetical protein